MDQLDVVIIGGGPSGINCAIAAQQAGLKYRSDFATASKEFEEAAKEKKTKQFTKKKQQLTNNLTNIYNKWIHNAC